MKYPAELTYAAFRHGTITRRFLFCLTDEKPKFGDPSFDFMAFFGFGSGEFEGETPAEYKHLRVKVQQLPDNSELSYAIAAETMQKDTRGFVGFYTKDGDTLYLLTEDSEGTLLTHMPDLNWHYYTQLGDRGTAYAHLRTMQRRHFIFETLEEQNEKLAKFSVLSASI